MSVVVLLGTMDTKGPEYDFMAECVRSAGATPYLVDVGVLGEPTMNPDTTAAEVARAAGVSLKSLRKGREGSDTRAVALETMQRGAQVVINRLLEEGRCDAVLGAGGSGGSSLISGVFREMPLGLPKILVSTVAGHNAAEYMGTRDIFLLNPITDIAGLNRVSRQVLGNAARAAAGAAARPKESKAERPLIALSMFGVTTPGVLATKRRLEDAGFETIVFHAVGTGGRALEEMVSEGLVDGVVELTVSELTDEYLGGVFSAGPDRLQAAGRRGIPQVVVPGAIEVLNFGPRDTVPAGFDRPERRLIVHNPYVSAVRTTREEAVELARILAGKINAATGPVRVLLPLRGFDSYQQEPDGPYIDRDSDDAFLSELRHRLDPEINYKDCDCNINDAQFADEVFESFMSAWRARAGA